MHSHRVLCCFPSLLLRATNFLSNLLILLAPISNCILSVTTLMSDSRVVEDFSQSKLFPRLDRKNTNICLLRVLKEELMNFKRVNFIFLKYRLICNSEILFLLIINSIFKIIPGGNCMFKVNNRNTRTGCEICLKLTIKAPERRQGLRCLDFD